MHIRAIHVPATCIPVMLHVPEIPVHAVRGRFSRDPLPVYPAEGPCEQFWQGQGCPLFDIIHTALPDD